VVVAPGKKITSVICGGRPPDADSVTGPAGHGTKVRVDPIRYIANEGSISIIDTTHESVAVSLKVGLHASAMSLSPNGRWLVIANSGSDSLSVLDTRTDKIVETISARQNPADLFWGAAGRACFDRSGKRLFVCNASRTRWQC